MDVLRQRLAIVLGSIGFILALGTVGYSAIEKWPMIDSFYMAVITMSTVGYGEVHTMSHAGQLFSVFLIVLSMGTVAVSLGYLTQAVVYGEIRKSLGRKKLETQISKMSDHYVICGYGRCGSVVCDELMRQKIPFVVVENDDDMIEELDEASVPFVEGDATDEDVLDKARIRHAKGLVTAVSSDSNNVFIILSGREMNPKLFIVARAVDGKSESKLRRAGADRVVMPYILGGRRMANAIVRPDVMDLIDFAFLDPNRNILMEQLTVPDTSPLVNATLAESDIRSRYGLMVIGIKKPDGQLVFNPPAEQIIREGDRLIVMGDISNLKHLRGEARLKTDEETA